MTSDEEAYHFAMNAVRRMSPQQLLDFANDLAGAMREALDTIAAEARTGVDAIDAEWEAMNRGT